MKPPVPFVILTVAALTAGCATAPRPTEESTRARTLIEQAEQNGAQRYAAADLQEARDKLQQSDEAANQGNMRAAQWRATEASADARLASARAASGKAEAAAHQVDQDLATLRSQTLQNGDPVPRDALPADEPPPPPPPPRALPPPPPSDTAPPQ